MSDAASVHARRQYEGSSDRLRARISIYDFAVGTPWYQWVQQHLPASPVRGVLEVGAGTGAGWEGARRAFTPLVLSDAFRPMCEHLKDVPSAVPLQCRAEFIPVREGSFGGVLASHVLYHLPDPLAGVDELIRVCAPGGWVAVTTNTTRHLGELVDIAQDCGIMRPGQQTHLRFDAEAAAAALAARVSNVTTHPYEVDLDINAPEPVVAYLSSIPSVGFTADQAGRLHDRIAAIIDSGGFFRTRSSASLTIARLAS